MILLHPRTPASANDSTLSLRNTPVAKWIVFFIALVPHSALQAQTYVLSPDTHCSSSDGDSAFSCRPGSAMSGVTLRIVRKDGAWFGEELISGSSRTRINYFPLDVIKSDSNAIALNYPVLWSGLATIVLITKSGQYYFSETSYSETLMISNVTVERGRFKDVTQKH